jgi:hypothetical protein
MVDGSVLGVADRAATPPGGIEAAAASWTIGSEEDGSIVYRSAVTS